MKLKISPGTVYHKRFNSKFLITNLFFKTFLRNPHNKDQETQNLSRNMHNACIRCSKCLLEENKKY